MSLFSLETIVYKKHEHELVTHFCDLNDEVMILWLWNFLSFLVNLI